MQSVPITTEVVSSNPTYGDKVVSDLRQVSGFLQVLWFPPPITDRHDVTIVESGVNPPIKCSCLNIRKIGLSLIYHFK